MIFVRLGLKILCGNSGEYLIIFVACESFYHVSGGQGFINASDSRD